MLSIHSSSSSQRDKLSHYDYSCIQVGDQNIPDPQGFAMKAVGVSIQPLWLILPNSVHEL